jgi:hypothetical protein
MEMFGLKSERTHKIKAVSRQPSAVRKIAKVYLMAEG